MCSHHRPTQDDRKWLKRKGFSDWVECELCKLKPKELPPKKLKIEEEEDGS